ncbi:MAG: isopentenyl-diphosphate Delta-isomerase [Pseudomonadota bacterium]
MLDDVLYLTPDAADGPEEGNRENCTLAPSNPAIMIPAIDKDGSYYPIEKIEAHISGVLHLALSVFIFDGEELLIQKRAESKYHCGGQWANTCCTHPHMGENMDDAVSRRLDEELGITVPVEEKRVVEYSADVGNGLWEHERVHMFRAQADKRLLAYSLNPEEVADIRWINARQLHREIANHPDQFTPWFKIYVERFPQLDF